MQDRGQGENKTILINFASRSRPWECLSAIRSIFDNADLIGLGRIEILFKFDEDDPEFEKYEALGRFGRLRIGKSDSKIHAINRGGIGELEWRWLVNMSDDMRFIKQGWDILVRELCGPDTFLHLPDNYAGDKLCTMSIMGRKYYDRFGYVYHPDYKSFFCDNEAHEVAQILGCYKLGPAGVIEHRHPAAGFPTDQQYKDNNKNWNHDKAIYEQRKKINFGL